MQSAALGALGGRVLSPMEMLELHDRQQAQQAEQQRAAQAAAAAQQQAQQAQQQAQVGRASLCVLLTCGGGCSFKWHAVRSQAACMARQFRPASEA